MYILHHSPFSQHARRVVSLFEGAGIPYQLKGVAMDRGEHLTPEFLQLNPNHQVPVLVDGDFCLYESNAILRYLATKHGLSNWYPEDVRVRALVDQWLDWNQCLLSPRVFDIVFNRVFSDGNGDQMAAARGEKDLPALFAVMEKALADTPYLAGSFVTIADLSLASNVFQLGLADIMPTTPNLSAWYERMMSLPGFVKSLPQ